MKTEFPIDTADEGNINWTTFGVADSFESAEEMVRQASEMDVIAGKKMRYRIWREREEILVPG